MADDESIQDEAKSLDEGTEDSYVGYMTPQNVQGLGAEAETDEPSDEELGEDEDLEEEDEEEEAEEEEEEEEPEQQIKPKKKPKKRVSDSLAKRKAAAKRKHDARMRQLYATYGQPQQGGPYQQYNQPYHPQNQPQFQQQPQQTQQAPEMKIEVPKPRENESFADYAQRAISESIKGAMQNLPQLIQGSIQQAMPQQQQGQQAPPPAQMTSEQQRRVLASIQASMDYLDEVYDDWHLYEDEMSELYRTNPATYSRNLDLLYEDGRKAYDQKNVQARAKKTKSKGKVVKYQTGRRPKGSTRTTKKKNAKMNLNEAWERAKRDALKR